MTYRSSTVNMVDCGNLRCFQERRLIKKELMTWSKKIPIAVGMYYVLFTVPFLSQKITCQLVKSL